jgi:hypothetical protein
LFFLASLEWLFKLSPASHIVLLGMIVAATNTQKAKRDAELTKTDRQA